MAYKMKGFVGFGKSRLKKDKKDNYTKEDYAFLKEQREERVKSTDYLTRTPNPTTKENRFAFFNALNSTRPNLG